LGIAAGALTVAAVVLLGTAAPAAGGARVFIGGTVGVPIYSYPYAYAYPYPYYPYAPYYYPPAYVPAPPPPAFEPGHWEWRYDPSGRPYQAWVPSHLR
jgi:hypothetical protein